MFFHDVQIIIFFTFPDQVRKVFEEKLENKDVSAAIAAIKTLLELIRSGKGKVLHHDPYRIINQVTKSRWSV